MVVIDFGGGVSDSKREVFWQKGLVTREARAEINNQKPCVLWFTGLSGAGKSSLAALVERLLFELGNRSYLVDGDNLRHGLNQDLSFGLADRNENVRRAAEVSGLFLDAGLIVLAALISPVREERDRIRRMFAEGDFIEIYVSTPLAICEERDVKGLYKKARAGEISQFTGISADYEAPLSPEIEVDMSQLTIQQAAELILDYMYENQKFGLPIE